MEKTDTLKQMREEYDKKMRQSHRFEELWDYDGDEDDDEDWEDEIYED